MSFLSSLLRNKLLMLAGGTGVVGGGIATPVVLASTQRDNSSIREQSRPTWENFFTEEKLGIAVNELKENNPVQIESSVPQTQQQLPTSKEINDFLRVSQEASKNYGKSPAPNSYRLSLEDRKILLIFCQLYSEIESKKLQLDSLADSGNLGEISALNLFSSSIACDDLIERLKGDEEKGAPINHLGDPSNNWGGDEGSKNPFGHFYRDKEEEGRSKMRKLKEGSSDYSEVILREMEGDIASGIIENMMRIHTLYLLPKDSTVSSNI